MAGTLKEKQKELDKKAKKAEEGIEILKSTSEIGEKRDVVKIILNTAAQTGFDTDYVNLTPSQQEDLVSDPNTVIDQRLLQELDIHANADLISIDEIIRILERREIPVAFQACTANILYDIEEIPVPSYNQIYSLISPSHNLFDKPTLTLKDIVSDAEFPTSDDYELTTTLKNFQHNRGGNYEFFVGGDENTEFSLVIQDITNTTWYIWDLKSHSSTTNGFTNGWSAYVSNIYGGNDKVMFSLPGVTAETTYHVYFTSTQFTNYAKELPTSGYPWVITQMPNTTTTVQMSTANNFGATGGELVIGPHPPGAHLNASNTTLGIYDIDITVAAGSGEGYRNISINPTIEVHDDQYKYDGDRETIGIVTIGEIDSEGSDDYTKTEIIDTDLTAQVEQNIGKVTGTITIREASIRSSVVEIITDAVFTLS
jgi:hypothetical protein